MLLHMEPLGKGKVGKGKVSYLCAVDHNIICSQLTVHLHLSVQFDTKFVFQFRFLLRLFRIRFVVDILSLVQFRFPNLSVFVIGGS